MRRARSARLAAVCTVVYMYTVWHNREHHLHVPLGVRDDTVAACAAGVAVTNLPEVNTVQ